MPVVWGSAGEILGILAACVSSANSLCGLAGILYGGVPGMVFGTWWGLRSVPRWVTVTQP
jgi:hypothetical protein